jgi:flagellar hook-length control protein FliK
MAIAAVPAAADPATPVDAPAKADSDGTPGGFAAVVKAVAGSKGEAKGQAGDATVKAGTNSKAGTDDVDETAKHADGDKPANAAAAAIAAALAALQGLSPDNISAAAPADAKAGTAVAGTATGPKTAGGPVGLMPGVPTEAAAGNKPDTTVEEGASKAGDAVSNGAAAPPMAPTPIALPPTEAGMNAAAAVAEASKIVAATPEPVKMEATKDDGAKDPPDKLGPPPTEGGAATQPTMDTNSVVRFVGNAEKQKDTSGENGNDTPGQPKASVQGIAHAAAGSAVGELRTATDPTAVTDVPKPAAPASVTPPAVEQVAHTVIEQVAQGGGEARIHLHPEDLGDVTIQVHVDGDHIHIQVHAERADAMNLLRDHTADLSNLLGNRGLNLGDVYVGLGGQQAGDSQPQQQSRTNGANSGEFASLMGLDSPAIERSNRLRSAYNPDGALSYLV